MQMYYMQEKSVSCQLMYSFKKGNVRNCIYIYIYIYTRQLIVSKTVWIFLKFQIFFFSKLDEFWIACVNECFLGNWSLEQAHRTPLTSTSSELLMTKSTKNNDCSPLNSQSLSLSRKPRIACPGRDLAFSMSCDLYINCWCSQISFILT